MGVGGGMIRCQPYFSTKSGSVARVWAAFCERSYEGGPTKWEVHSKYNKKCTYASKARIIFKKDRLFFIFQIYGNIFGILFLNLQPLHLTLNTLYPTLLVHIGIGKTAGCTRSILAILLTLLLSVFRFQFSLFTLLTRAALLPHNSQTITAQFLTTMEPREKK